MPVMTEKEADVLDELVTKNPPKVSGDGTNGFFMKHKGNVIIVDDLSATYLRSKAEASHTTPSEVIGDMIRREIMTADRIGA